MDLAVFSAQAVSQWLRSFTQSSTTCLNTLSSLRHPYTGLKRPNHTNRLCTTLFKDADSKSETFSGSKFALLAYLSRLLDGKLLDKTCLYDHEPCWKKYQIFIRPFKKYFLLESELWFCKMSQEIGLSSLKGLQDAANTVPDTFHNFFSMVQVL